MPPSNSSAEWPSRPDTYVLATVLAAVAPALAAALYVVVALMAASYWTWGKVGGALLLFFGFSFYALFISFPFVLFLGLPIFVVLKCLGWVRWWTLVVAGVVAAWMPTLLIPWWPFPTSGLTPLIDGSCGALAGLTAWLVIRKAEPSG